MIKNRVGIVVGIDHYNTLGVIRSLGKAKIDVELILLTNTNDTYVDKSKYVTVVHRNGHDLERMAKTIKQISKTYDRCFVFPLTDETAAFLDSRYKEFPSNIIIPNMKGHMPDYQNKFISKQYALQAGLHVAEGILLKLEEAKQQTNWDNFPTIIKPLASIEGFKSDIVIVKNKTCFEDELKSFAKKGYKQVLVEKYIDSEDSYMLEVMGFSTSHYVVVTGIIKKYREYPIKNGSTSYASTIINHPALSIEAIQQYIRRSGYIGLFDVEFKYSDGVAYFIECNFRNGAPNYALTSIANVNTPYLWMQYIEDNIIPIDLTRNHETNFMVEQTDILNCLKREVPLRTWIKEFIKSKKIFFLFDDTKPVYSYIKQMTYIALERVKRR